MNNMAVTFFGTSSGGGPSESRNCSSLILEITQRDGSIWMVDCGEGTLRQFSLQGHPFRLKASKLSKMFITHLHADHIMGIVPILRSILYPPQSDTAAPSTNPPRIEIFGPAGLRTFVRSIMQMTLTRTADRYVVHELLTPQDTPTPCSPSDILHYSEAIGRDIVCSDDGFWKNIISSPGVYGNIVVEAGPIEHRDPCLGYIIRETAAPSRKLVVLGDTCDPSDLVPLIQSTPEPVSLLIHEATDAHIPKTVDPSSRRTLEIVHEKCLARGHSTPIQAGHFARVIGAQKLILNHIGSRFPAPRYHARANDIRSAVIREIERQASEAWQSGFPAKAAWDFMRVDLPAPVAEAGQQAKRRRPSSD